MGVRFSQPTVVASGKHTRATPEAKNVNSSTHQRRWNKRGWLRIWPCFGSPNTVIPTLERVESNAHSLTSSNEERKDGLTVSSVKIDDISINVEEPSPECERQCLERAGVHIARQFGDTTLTERGRALCRELSNFHYPTPEKTLYEGNNLFRLLDTVRTESHTRVFRDLTPLIVPSPETLFRDGLSTVGYLKEKVYEGWRCIVPVAEGPTIRPDFAVGLHPSAFTEHERKRLDDYYSPNAPAQFCEDMYFPFFTCSLKVSDL